jgi:hypothetical protein
VRFLITMNMPSAKGYSVHQITVEHNAKTMKEFWNVLQDNEFIMPNLMYKIRNDDLTEHWEDRGLIIINTAHIGKVQELIEFREDRYGS